MKRIRSGLNRVIGLLKWPTAVFMVVAVLPAFQTDLDLLKHVTDMNLLLYFFAPMLGIGLLFFITGLYGSFFVIAEHELTHMLFAALTFHRPRGLVIEQGAGGSFSFSGEGNWLIALAPYFFPTFAFVVMLASLLFPEGQPVPDVYLSVLGSMIGYHLVATILEIHPKQTDFKVAGYFFTICFLPGINLIAYGLLFGFSVYGWKIFPLYFSALMAKIQVVYPYLTF